MYLSLMIGLLLAWIVVLFPPLAEAKISSCLIVLQDDTKAKRDRVMIEFFISQLL
ncbi:hypothetical protein D3C87_2157870 [compost metagenome]